jgi:hypothetical protein
LKGKEQSFFHVPEDHTSNSKWHSVVFELRAIDRVVMPSEMLQGTEAVIVIVAQGTVIL